MEEVHQQMQRKLQNMEKSNGGLQVTFTKKYGNAERKGTAGSITPTHAVQSPNHGSDTIRCCTSSMSWRKRMNSPKGTVQASSDREK